MKDPRHDDRRVDDGRGEGPDERNAVERWVLPYFEDSSLWPVLLVVLFTIAAFMAPAIASAVRDLHLPSALAIVSIGFVTIRLIHWEWARRGRPGAIGVSLLIVWLLAGGAAYYGARAGLL